MSSVIFSYPLPTPGRMLRQIENAELMEEELDSLPPPLPSDESSSQSLPHHHHRDLYDVGVNEASENITVVPRTLPNILPSQSNPASIPKPHPSKQQPTDTDAPRTAVDSPLTSTPATIHPAQRSSRLQNNPLTTLSPNVSHIPQNRNLHQDHDVIMLVSSGTENDNPQPDILEENSFNSSDSDDADCDLSKKSLGELNFSALDDYMPGFESDMNASNKPQRTHQRNIHTQKNPSQSCPSPSSSQSTLIAHSQDKDTQNRHLQSENRTHDSNPESIPSPGVGRRDSFRLAHSMSMDDISRSFSQDVDHEFEHSKRPSPQPFQSFHPEPTFTPATIHRNRIQSSITNPSSNFRARNVLQTNSKPLQSQIPSRSARRAFVTRHLTEIAEDSTDLSVIPPNQLNDSTDSPPPAQLAESECESTSHDLTTFPTNRHLNRNSSFSFADPSQRFNGNKLNSYLHTLNGRLTDENQRVVDLLTETKAKLEQLTVENQSLRDQVGKHHALDDPNQSDLSERSGAMLGKAQNILDHSIAQLQNQITTVQGDDKESPLLESSSRNILLERQNRWLQDQLKQRDDEIEQLRGQLTNKFPVTKSSLHKDNVELKDHLSDVRKELAAKDEEVVKLRLELLEASGQRASAVSELNSKYEQAKDCLSETQEALGDAKLEVQVAKNELETRMSALKSEFEILLTEQANRHASAVSKLKEARKLNETQANELKELKANQSQLQRDPDAFLTLKSELEQVLAGKGDHSIGRSAERRVRMLVSWLDSEISNSCKTSQDIPLPATHDVEKSSQEIQQLRRKIEEFRARIEELIQESSDKHNQVETLEQLLSESESARIHREGELAELEAQTDILEAKVVTQQATIQGLEVKLSHVLSSTFSDVSFTPSRLSPNRESAHYHVELSKAQREINRLKDLLDKSSDPAAGEIQNLKMKALETHRRELEDRVGSLRRQASALMSTPSRSSIHFQSVISLRTPRTPGQFLANANSILVGDSGDETIVPMLNQINELHQLVEQLRHQLDLANMDIDKKLEKLTEANQNTVKASADVINVQQRADELERKSHLLEQRLNNLIAENGTIAQVQHRLSNIGCPQCGEKFDANEVVRFRVVPEAQELEFTDQPADTDTEDQSPTLKTKFKELEEKHQTSQREIIKYKREVDLKSDQLEQLQSEKVNFENEIDELHHELSLAQSNVERLESQLHREEGRFREISTKQQAVINEKNDLAGRLEAVNLELRQTQAELSEVTQAHNSLDAEIRAIKHSKNEASQVPLTQINQLQTTISKLEAEKGSLSEQQESLIKQVSTLKNELESQTHMVANQEKSYHRVQALLEKQANEANKLRNELETKSKEALDQKNMKDSLVRDTNSLRKELITVKSEAQNLNYDLQQLKDQVNRKSSSTSANEIARMKNELSLCKKELNNHNATKQSQRDSRLGELENKHNSESKGLLLRIRFLKLMFTRESIFRADLAFQKKLIMVKLHHAETTNRAIYLALADFGLPCPLPPSWNTSGKDGKQGGGGNFTIHSTDRSFKSIAIAVRAICKLKILSKNWSKEVIVKEKLKGAYKDVRGKEFIGD